MVALKVVKPFKINRFMPRIKESERKKPYRPKPTLLVPFEEQHVQVYAYVKRKYSRDFQRSIDEQAKPYRV